MKQTLALVALVLLAVLSGSGLWYEHTETVALQTQVGVLTIQQTHLSASVAAQTKVQKRINQNQVDLNWNQKQLAKAVEAILKALMESEKPSGFSHT